MRSREAVSAHTASPTGIYIPVGGTRRTRALIARFRTRSELKRTPARELLTTRGRALGVFVGFALWCRTRTCTASLETFWPNILTVVGPVSPRRRLCNTPSRSREVGRAHAEMCSTSSCARLSTVLNCVEALSTTGTYDTSDCRRLTGVTLSGTSVDKSGTRPRSWLTPSLAGQ